MKNPILRLLVIQLLTTHFALNTSAQSLQPSVLATAGGNFSNANAQVSWTLGETFIQTLAADSAMLTEGFHQPEPCLSPTSAQVTGNPEICAGESTSLTATAAGTSASSTYSWTGPNGFTANTAIIPNLSAAGTYTCIISNGQGCSVTISQNLIVNTVPTPAITAGGPTTFCSGGSISLSAPAGFTYLWSNGATSQSITVSSAGSYTVQTISGTCTSAVSQPTQVIVNQTPQTPSITSGGPTSFCDGGSVSLSAPAGFTYLWSNGSTNQTISVNSTGSYSVQIISGSCTSAVSQATEVTVNQAPQTPSITAGGPTTFCSGGSVSLSAPAGFTYLWSNGATTQNISANSTGSYTVQTIANACTSAVSQTTEVTVNQTPQTPSITAGGPTTFCDGGSVTLSAPGGFTYLWSNGSTNQSITVGSTGSYSVQTISVTCTSVVSQGTQVSVLPNPDSDFTISTMGAEVQLNYPNPSAIAPDSLRWDFGDGQTSSETSPIHLYESSGIFSICLRTFLDDCSSQTCKPVQITVTGIKPESGIAVSVLPNPSRGLYQLEIDNLRGTARIEVLDALGKLVYEGQLSSQGMKTHQELDIRHLAAGIYTLRLQSSDGPKYLRLKKE